MKKIKIPEMITNCMRKRENEDIYNDIAINGLKKIASIQNGYKYLYVKGLQNYKFYEK